MSTPLSQQLGAGRALPRLLFVTHRRALDARIGARGASAVIDLLHTANDQRPRAQRHVIVEHLGVSLLDRPQVLAEVHAALRENAVEGVVLLGGYDVVPTMRFDCLPPWLRTWADAQPLDADDADDWTVWCDDPYGDPLNTGLPEIPVTRIPDGCSMDLMLAALRAPVATQVRRRGMRNVRRPFADEVFAELPGDASLLVSAPRHASGLAESALRGSHVYLMLHGRYDVGGALWGERQSLASQAEESEAGEAAEGDGTPSATESATVTVPLDISVTFEHRQIARVAAGMVTAVECAHMPGDGAVILSGCCWSAGVAASTARRWQRVGAPKARRAGNSIALAALRDGARAFVGSTGTNYSPLNRDDRFYCAPMHVEFWQQVVAGQAPARALLIAKHRYASGMPHGRRDDWGSLAIEHKTLHQYTCLGLGW